jgi:hypothetical protein
LLVRGRRLFLVSLAVLALLVPSAAFAGPPDDDSGVDQYVEDIPTSEGSKPVGSKGSGTAALPSGVGRSLDSQGGDDAALLEALATQSGLGAPTDALAGRAAAGPDGSSDDVSLGDALSGGFGALAGNDGRGSAGGLLLALIVLTGVIVYAAARRSRRRGV